MKNGSTEDTIRYIEAQRPDREKRQIMISALKIATILNEESSNRKSAIKILDTALECLNPRFAYAQEHYPISDTLKVENRINENSK